MTNPPPPDSDKYELTPRERIGFAVTSWIVIGLAALAHQALVRGGLQHTALLFIGLPTLMGAGFAFFGPRRHAVLTTARGLLLALIIAFSFLGEAAACVVMAAPIFLGVAGIVQLSRPIDEHKRGPGTIRGLAILAPLLLMSLEGTNQTLSFNRDEQVTVEDTLAATPASFETALTRLPRFDRPLPWFFHLGFPRPLAVRGEGLDIGDRRIIVFGGGASEPGELVLEITERAPGRVTFRAVSDSSQVAHWLRWQGAEVQWVQQGDGTLVRWTLAYRRRLDPAWYFGPLERYAVGLAARVLIETHDPRNTGHESTP